MPPFPSMSSTWYCPSSVVPTIVEGSSSRTSPSTAQKLTPSSYLVLHTGQYFMWNLILSVGHRISILWVLPPNRAGGFQKRSNENCPPDSLRNDSMRSNAPRKNAQFTAIRRRRDTAAAVKSELFRTTKLRSPTILVLRINLRRVLLNHAIRVKKRYER